MDLDTLKSLPASDQQTFLVGRIGMETVRMDVALRFLNGMLRGSRSFDAYLDAPDGFRADARECDRMIHSSDRSDTEKEALLAAVEAARVVYGHRNRYVHRFLRSGFVRREQWELAHVSRPGDDLSEVDDVSFDEMVSLVCEIIGVTHRLRAAAMHVVGQSSWSDLLYAHVEGEWDGSANWTGADDGD